MFPYTVTQDGFLRMEILPDDVEWARAQAAEMGALRNSIRNGEGNLTGFLGEALVRRAFDGGATNTYDFDLTFEDHEGKVEFEVKTKDRTVPPRSNYFASVANYNTRQRAACYVFVSLFRPDKRNKEHFTHGYICGIIPKAEFMAKALFFRQGDLDPSDDRGIFTFTADCYNVAYGELHGFDGWR